MKLQFEHNLDYQLAGINAVCDLFAGQEVCRTEFTVTAPRSPYAQVSAASDAQGHLPADQDRDGLPVPHRPRFRQRVEAIVEAFSSMQEDLDKERKAIMKQWAKREQQIERVMGATVGMYGDLQGIAGKSLQEIEGLELSALDGPDTKRLTL